MTNQNFIEGAIRTVVGRAAVRAFLATLDEDDLDRVADVARQRGVTPRTVMALKGYIRSPGGGWQYVTKLKVLDPHPRKVQAAFAVRSTLLRMAFNGKDN